MTRSRSLAIGTSLGADRSSDPARHGDGCIAAWCSVGRSLVVVVPGCVVLGCWCWVGGLGRPCGRVALGRWCGSIGRRRRCCGCRWAARWPRPRQAPAPAARRSPRPRRADTPTSIWPVQLVGRSGRLGAGELRRQDPRTTGLHVQRRHLGPEARTHRLRERRRPPPAMRPVTLHFQDDGLRHDRHDNSLRAAPPGGGRPRPRPGVMTSSAVTSSAYVSTRSLR